MLKKYKNKFKLLTPDSSYQDIIVFLFYNRKIAILDNKKKINLFELEDFKNKIIRDEIISIPDTGIQFNLYLRDYDNKMVEIKDYFIQELEDLKEIEDEYRKMDGQKTSSEGCVETYKKYIFNPSESNKLKLLIDYLYNNYINLIIIIIT